VSHVDRAACQADRFTAAAVSELCHPGIAEP
jgi:hypothetical protein